VAWQFATRDEQGREAREHTALLVTAVSFFALAVFVAAGSLRALADGERAAHSTAGVALAAASLAVMPALSLAQRRAGRELGSSSAVADSKQTPLCTYLSGVLLLGLASNLSLGWWWADLAAALVIAAAAVREGQRAWRGGSCCAPGGIWRGAGQHNSGHCADGCASGCACCALPGGGCHGRRTAAAAVCAAGANGTAP
jgi:Cation efflux family